MAVKPQLKHVDWTASIWAGLIGGVVFLALEMILVPLALGGSPWGPPRMIAAIVLGNDVLPVADGPAPTFNLGIMLAALLVHFVLSLVYASILDAVIYRFGTGVALVDGAIFGLVLYFVNFYLFTAIFPWFAMARNWVSVVAHLVFGLVVALAYKRIERPKLATVEPPLPRGV